MSTIPFSIINPNEAPATTEIATASVAATSIVVSTVTPSSTQSSNAQAPSSTPTDAPALTPAQIAGVTISGVAAAVIVFFLVGALLSCHRRRKRTRSKKPNEDRSHSRFGNSDKEVVTLDVERAQHNKDGHPAFDSRSDVGRAYPTIADPEKIGVAVSSPSQTDRTPVSAQSTTSWARLLPSRPAAAHVSPPRAYETNLYVPNNLEPARYELPTPVSPPSACQETFGPSVPFELHGESTRKHVPPPLRIQRPRDTKAPASANVPRKAPQRESTQSVSTIINDEPMSPSARQSVVKIIPRPIQTTNLRSQARENAELRDYIPSYYMQNSATTATSPAVPALPSATDLPTVDASKDTHSRRSKRDSPLSPAVSRFSRPVAIATNSSTTKGREQTLSAASQAPHVASAISQPTSPPSLHAHIAAPPRSKPVTAQYGLPSNPRNPPKGFHLPTRVDSISRPRGGQAIATSEPTTSPPSSWRHPAERANDHQSKTPPPDKHPASKPKSAQKAVAPPVRKASQKSVASMTSFETSEDEPEVTPSEHESRNKKHLSPLPEANGERSPISGLKYPKVPRPANQSATRSTGSPTRPGRDEQPGKSLRKQPSNSSLLEKRKGSDAASDLQRALWITGSNGSTSSRVVQGPTFPSHAPSRTQLHSRQSSSAEPEMEIKSPLWEPKLTPRRDSSGGLIIEVS